MNEPTPIIIPLINPNEPGALLVALHASNGQHVHKGDRLCTLETTKSTLELLAEADGYLVGLTHSEGQAIQFGDILGYLSDSPDWVPPVSPVTSGEVAIGAPQGLRISQAALTLARAHGIDLGGFTSDVFVTEKMIRDMLDKAAQPAGKLLAEAYRATDILIYGGGGHGKSLIDLIRLLGSYSIVGIIDDGLAPGESIMGVPVLGGSSSLDQLRLRGLCLAANAVGGIGNISSRITVFQRLAGAGFSCPTLVHPTAFVEPSANLSEGVQVFPHAYVGSEAAIGFGVIVNTGAIVSHDCQIGEYSNLSPGAILAGEVNVGQATLVGMGVTVNLRVKIGAHARIGNGATVKQDIPEGGLVRAGTIWPE